MADIEWRALEWLPNYEISEFGDVRKLIPASPVRGWIQDGYRHYAFRLNKKKYTFLAHRLCCEAFHGPAPPANPLCAHRDDDRGNNHYSNLRWTDRQGNADDAMRNGLYDRSRRHVAPECDLPDTRSLIGTAKLTWEQVNRIRQTPKSPSAIAREYGIAPLTVRRILNGETWRASL